MTSVYIFNNFVKSEPVNLKPKTEYAYGMDM
jgi:hypothetical protein